LTMIQWITTKTSDFVRFTGVVVLLIGNSRSTSPDPRDLELVAEAEAVFAVMQESGCTIAAQCRKALSSLSGHAKDGRGREVMIPYFGKVVRTELQDPDAQSQTIPENTNVQHTPFNIATVSTSEKPTTWVAGQSTEFTYNIEDFTTGSVWGIEGLSDGNASMPFGLDAASLDIDDDWGQFTSTTSLNLFAHTRPKHESTIVGPHRTIPLAMEDKNVATTETTTRVAYIRTILDKEHEKNYTECDWSNMRGWLDFWVGQRVYQDPHGFYGYNRRVRSSQPPNLHHHYILGHSNAADDFALEWFLQASRPDGWRLSRTDFEVYLSEAQVNDPANKQFLQRLESEGVSFRTVDPSTPAEFTTEDICDSVMLSESDYVLESAVNRAGYHGSGMHTLYRDALRHNHPQRYTKELSDNYYAYRLKNKMGHTQRECCYPHGKSDFWKREHKREWELYKCPSCGKRCKRNKGCKTTGEWWAEDKSKTAWSEGVDTSAPRPPDFEKAWRILSVEDVVNNWGPDWLMSQRFRNWKWRSVDTFSGEE
ncbi:hypothetical protein FALBO_11761, partial [Fusarium albosuccineum]